MNSAAAEGPSPAQEHEALLQFLYMAPIGLAQTSMDGTIALINPLCAQLLMPLSPDGTLANLFTVLRKVAPDLDYRAQSFGPLHGKVCDTLHLQVDAGVPGGRDAQVLSLTLLKLDEDRLMAVLDDVSQSVKRERELRHSQAWIHSIATGIFDVDYALMSLDARGLVQGWNTGIRKLTGFEAEATVGQSYANFYPEGDMLGHRVLERLREADLTGWNLEEGWLRRMNGDRYWGSCLIAPLETDDEYREQAYSLIIRDISDRREANEALRRSVWSDHLTGLANRRALFEAAAAALQRCARAGLPMSVVLCDADHSKAVNDTHGHSAGDAVLRHLAAGLSATFGAADIVARFGGEEFVVLMAGASQSEANTMAERFRAHMASNAVTVDGTAVFCTVSAGVATVTDDSGSFDQLLQRADTALYAAKAAGRNRVAHWHDALVPLGRGLQSRAVP